MFNFLDLLPLRNEIARLLVTERENLRQTKGQLLSQRKRWSMEAQISWGQETFFRWWELKLFRVFLSPQKVGEFRLFGNHLSVSTKNLGGGFKYFLCSPPSLGKWSNLTNICFQMGWKHQPVLVCFSRIVELKETCGLQQSWKPKEGNEKWTKWWETWCSYECLPTIELTYLGTSKRKYPMGMGLRFEHLRCSFNVHKRNAMSMSECALSTNVWSANVFPWVWAQRRMYSQVFCIT